MLKKRKIFVYLIVFICLSYALEYKLFTNNAGNVNVFENTTFTSNLTLTESEIESCDPDVLNEFNECWIQAKYILPEDIINNSELDCDLNITSVETTLYYYNYDPTTKTLTCDWYFNSNDCESDISGLTSFLLYTNITTNNSRYYTSDVLISWPEKIYVNTCNYELESCTVGQSYWNLCYDISNTTKIMAPFLNSSLTTPYEDAINITRTVDLVDGEGEPKVFDLWVYSGDVFNLSLNATNVQDEYHSGKSFYDWMNLTEWDSGYLELLSEQNISLGNMSSGWTNITNFTFKALQSTDVPAKMMFNLSDFSGNYNDSVLINVNVVNLSVPYFYVKNNTINKGNYTLMLLNVSGNATDIENVRVYYGEVNKPVLNTDFVNETTALSCIDDVCSYALLFGDVDPGYYNLTAEIYAEKRTLNYSVSNAVSNNFDVLVYDIEVYDIKMNNSFDIDDEQNLSFMLYSKPELVRNVTISFISYEDEILYNKKYNDSVMNCSYGCSYNFSVSGLDVGMYDLIITADTEYIQPSFTKKGIIAENLSVNNYSIIYDDENRINNTVFIYLNISGNVTSINKMKYNISYFDYFDNSLKSVIINGSYGDYGGYNYLGILKINRSGYYNVSVFINSSTSLYLERLNNSDKYDFYIEFATPMVEFIFPKIRVLYNQSFNYSFIIYSLEGDLINSGVDIVSLNDSVLNISCDSATIPNLRAGENYTVICDAETINMGNDIVMVKVDEENPDNKIYVFNRSHVVDTIYVEPLYTVTDIYNDTQKIIAKVSGNVTEINQINVNIVNDLFGINDDIVLELNNSLNESDCFDMSYINETNVLYSGNVIINSSGGYNPENSIDEDVSSFWLGYSGTLKAYINYTLDNEYPIESINILALSQSGNPINVSLYVYDNNWVLWDNIEINGTKKWYNASQIFKSVSKISLVVNTTNENILIYEVEAKKTNLEDNNLCYVYVSPYPPQHSGNYTIEGYTDKFESKKTNMFVEFGDLELRVEDNTYKYYTNNTYESLIIANNGDLANISVKFKSWNESIVKISDGSNDTVNLSLLSSAEIVLWNISALNKGNTTISFIVYDEIKNKTEYYNATINVITEDLIDPNISYVEISSDITNLGTPLDVYVSANDDIKIDRVFAEVFLPNGSSYNSSDFDLMSGNITEGVWKGSIDKYLDVLGNYSIKIYVQDLNISHIVSYNQTLHFNTTDKYTLKSDSYTIYNRGQDINVSIYDVNDVLVKNVSCEIVLNESLYNHTLTAESNYTEENGSLIGYYSEVLFDGILENGYFDYLISKEKNLTDYILYMNCSKNGNKGNLTKKFRVTNILDIEKLSPPDSITVNNPYIVNILVKYINGIKYSDIYINLSRSYITCLNKNNTEVNATLLPTFNYYLYPGELVLFNKTQCYGPSDMGYTYLKVYVYDTYNNFASYEYPIYAFDTNYIGSSSENVIQSSGGGTKIVYNKTNETKYIYVGENLTNKEIFTMNLSTIIIDDLKQGFNRTVLISLSNKGNRTYYVYLWINSTGFVIKYPDKVLLKPYSSKTIDIEIHAPLYLEPGQYTLKIIGKSKDVPYEKGLMIILQKNPLIKSIEDYNKTLIILKKELLNYEKTGLDTKEIEMKIDEAMKLVNNAEMSIYEDNLDYLRGNLTKIQYIEKMARDELLKKRVVKFLMENKWQIVAISTALGLLLWVFIIWVIPLYTISRRMHKLNEIIANASKTKKSTEKQYFIRKIDEQTYRKIMEKEHERLLSAKSELNHLEKEWYYLIRFKLGKLHEYRQKLLEKEKLKEKQRMLKEGKKIHSDNEKKKLSGLRVLFGISKDSKKDDKNKEYSEKIQHTENKVYESDTESRRNNIGEFNNIANESKNEKIIEEKADFSENRNINDVVFRDNNLYEVNQEVDNKQVSNISEDEEEKAKDVSEEDVDYIIEKLKKEFED